MVSRLGIGVYVCARACVHTHYSDCKFKWEAMDRKLEDLGFSHKKIVFETWF